MSGTQERLPGSAMHAVSNTMVKLHKEQFGRGPTNARSYFAGPDTLVCTLEDSLLPAERTMVEMGEDQHVRESRMFLQVATSDRFIAAVEELVSRKVSAAPDDLPLPSRCGARALRRRHLGSARVRGKHLGGVLRLAGG